MYIVYKPKMVRANKSEKQSATPAPVKTEKVAAPKAEKVAAPKAEKTKKPKAVEAAPQVEVAAPVENVVVSSVDVVDGSNSPISQRLSEFSAKLQQAIGVVSAIKTEYRTLEKLIQRELKASQKSSAKKAKRAGNRTPSGFVKPTLISNELAQFLGKEPGVELARTAVSKEINQYIRDNNLQDKENGRRINPDAKLSALLKFSPGDELTYFNLQRYMKHHFRKAEPVAAVATA